MSETKRKSNKPELNETSPSLLGEVSLAKNSACHSKNYVIILTNG